MEYIAPAFCRTPSTCPFCGVISRHRWMNVDARGGPHNMDGLWKSLCDSCQQASIWYMKEMIYPDVVEVELPSVDLREDIRRDYLEAASIARKSPRGAAALLRLCIQKLCQQLGEKGENINDDIASLVRKGLPVKVQQSLDLVRVIGNNAVHPGKIDIADDQETALQLFRSVNLIAHVMITQPREIDALYTATLPQAIREHIDRRDGKVSTGSSATL